MTEQQQGIYMPSSGVAGSCCRFIPSFKRSLHTVLHNGYISLNSHQQCKRVLFSPHSLQHLLFLDILMMAVLVVVRWHLTVVLICISLIMSNVVSSCLLATCISSLEKCLFRYSANFFFFLLSCLFFWYWAVWAAYIFWSLTLFQLLCLHLFSPILRVVFSSCLQFPLLGKILWVLFGPISLFLFLFPFL